MALTAPTVPALVTVAPPAKTKLLPFEVWMVVVPVPDVSPSVRAVKPLVKVADISTVWETPPKAPLTVAMSAATVPPGTPAGDQLAAVFQSSGEPRPSGTRVYETANAEDADSPAKPRAAIEPRRIRAWFLRAIFLLIIFS